MQMITNGIGNIEQKVKNEFVEFIIYIKLAKQTDT